MRRWTWIAVYRLKFGEDELSLAFIQIAEVLSSVGHYMSFPFPICLCEELALSPLTAMLSGLT